MKMGNTMLWATCKIKDTAVPITTHCIMRMYWGMGVQLKAFLISAFQGGKQSVTPQPPYPTYIQVQGWADPRNSVNTEEHRKTSAPAMTQHQNL